MKRGILFFVFLIVTATSVLADAPAATGDVQYDIRVDGITCPFCVATSERALKKIEGVHAVGSNLETGKMGAGIPSVSNSHSSTVCPQR